MMSQTESSLSDRCRGRVKWRLHRRERDSGAGFGLDNFIYLWTGESEFRRRDPHECKAEIDMAMHYVPDETKRALSYQTERSIDLERHVECGPFF